MYARLFSVAICFTFVGPAFADLEITSNHTIDSTNDPPVNGQSFIHVRNDAVLTIQDGPDGSFPVIGHIYLHDNASLIVNGGRLRGKIGIWGDNRVEFHGGDFDHSFLGDGNLAFVADNFVEINGRFLFSGGVQTYELHAMIGLPTIYLGVEDSLVGYSDEPQFTHARDSSGYEYYSIGSFGTPELYGEANLYPDVQVPFDGAQFNFTIHDTTGRPDGDADLDGDVDLDDLNIVRNAFGAPTSAFHVFTSRPGHDVYGDTLPYDGKVDLDDLNRVRNYFGGGIENPVPEPSSFALLTFAALGVIAPRRIVSTMRRF